MDPQSPVLTHGYVHGHVHHHRNHVHIHGHIHNHDHVPQDAMNAVTGDASVQLPDTCKQFNDLDTCGDIFCEDLDDCYFLRCDQLDDIIGDSSLALDGCFGHHLHATESTDFPGSNINESLNNSAITSASTSNIGSDATSTTGQNYDNICATESLCKSQRPRLNIFESIINNVLQNIEQYTAQPADLHLKTDHDSSLHLHFPHHCHLDDKSTHDEIKDPHMVHQSCFHAKILVNGEHKTELEDDSGLKGSKEELSDFDFFAQFNNFSRIVEPELESASMLPYVLPNNSFDCQWDSCAHRVSNASLVDHVVSLHLKQQPLAEAFNQHLEFECEWDHCSFIDPDLNVFLGHLRSHRIDIEPTTPHDGQTHYPSKNRIRSTNNNQHISPLHTPQSIEPMSDSLQSVPVAREDPFLLDITQMKIYPKMKSNPPLADASFTCKWDLGKDDDGKPIICNKTHTDEGSLQKHLEVDHIGLGHSIYHCCWDGCERHNGKPFVQRQKLHRHIHVHTGHKPCKCDICGSLFAVLAMLKQHQRIHSGEKPYQCNECERQFSTSSSLAIHMRVHLGVKPLRCQWPGCGRSFRESSNLAKHMRIHRPYTCTECQQVFDKRKDYMRHCEMHKTVASPRRKQVVKSVT